MTAANVNDALDLVGQNGIYPNTVSWGSTINLTFLTSIPTYYPAGYSLGFEPPRLSRRLLSVRRSHDEQYKEQVLA